MVHFIWPVMTERPFFTSSDQGWYTLWSCQMCATPYPISWIIFILDLGPSYTDKLISRDFMDSLNQDNQADVIETFNSTSRYLDDLLNIDNPYFEGMVT